MKKSVIFLIAVLYLVSIVVITFFGIQIRVDQHPVRMTEIKFTNEDIFMFGNAKTIEIVFDEAMNEDGVAYVLLNYNTAPDNASHPEKVNFRVIAGQQYDDALTNAEGNPLAIAGVTRQGEVWFSRAGLSLTIEIYTTDGSNLQDKIDIYCL